MTAEDSRINQLSSGESIIDPYFELDSISRCIRFAAESIRRGINSKSTKRKGSFAFCCAFRRACSTAFALCRAFRRACSTVYCTCLLVALACSPMSSSTTEVDAEQSYRYYRFGL
uniref:Uncharacterized protein n=1 Tax=Pseudo-nitzschia australis TaxID=44445 RepID=A0A7S4AV90_9STRA